MSEQNVDSVLASYEWGNRERKFARPWWHDDGEYVNSREDPDHARHRGVEAIEELASSWLEAYPDLTIQPLEARANDDMVFVWVRFSGTPAGSAAPLAMEMAHVVTLEDGKVRRLEEYFGRAEALGTVGLQD